MLESNYPVRTIGFAILVLAIAVSHLLTVLARRRLTHTHQTLLRKEPSHIYFWNYIGMVGLLTGGSLYLKDYAENPWPLVAVVVLAFLGALYGDYSHLRRLRSLGLPATYLRTARHALLLANAGLFINLVIILATVFRKI